MMRLTAAGIIIWLLNLTGATGLYAQQPRLVESFTLTWPSDNRLCDTYAHSEGYLEYQVFRLVSTGQVVQIHHSGNYCQGDSEFDVCYCFDDSGHVWLEETGALLPAVTFYRFGRARYTISFGDELAGITEITQTPLQDTVVKRLPDTGAEIQGYYDEMQARLQELRRLPLKDMLDRREADSLARLLETAWARKVEYQPGFVYRKPRPLIPGVKGESGWLTGTDIRVRREPGTTGEATDKVQYHTLGVEVLNIGPSEDIRPYGRHPWYYIRYTRGLSGPKAEGWIFGAFLRESVFPAD